MLIKIAAGSMKGDSTGNPILLPFSLRYATTQILTQILARHRRHLRHTVSHGSHSETEDKRTICNIVVRNSWWWWPMCLPIPLQHLVPNPLYLCEIHRGSAMLVLDPRSRNHVRRTRHCSGRRGTYLISAPLSMSWYTTYSNVSPSNFSSARCRGVAFSKLLIRSTSQSSQVRMSSRTSVDPFAALEDDSRMSSEYTQERNIYSR